MELSARQKERVESLLNESDGLRLFLQNAVTSALGFNLTTSEIVEKYAGFCSNRGWNMTIRKTEEQLPDLMMELFHVARSNNIPSGTTKVRGYRGGEIHLKCTITAGSDFVKVPTVPKKTLGTLTSSLTRVAVQIDPPMKIPLPTELFFESALGSELVDKIQAVAMDYLRPLFVKDYEKILGQLARNPTQKSAMTMECGHFELEAYPEPIFLLRVVTYDLGDARCLAFFGPKSAIDDHVRSVYAQLKQTLGAEGVDAMMVEQCTDTTQSWDFGL